MDISPVGAVVTGASRGIGLATCVSLTRQGYAVAGVARSFLGLAAPERRLLLKDSNSMLIECDLATPQGVATVSDELRARNFPSVSVIVNNAATATPLTPLNRATFDDFDYAFRLNVVAPAMMVRAFLPMLREQKGLVVNVTSSAADPANAMPGLGVYSVTKVALERLTASLAREEPDVTFIAARPGRVDTAMQATLRSLDNELAETANTFTEAAAKGQLRSARAIADAIVRLCQKPGTCRSGSVVTV